jgi:hypothetical protein
MIQDIKPLLKEATKGMLTDDSLNQIETAFNEAVDTKVQLNVESALDKQDTDYTDKLKELLVAIDDDHTKKLVNVVEAIDHNNTVKLKSVIKRYSKALTEDAKNLQEKLVSDVSIYLETYLNDIIPQDAVNAAVQNKKARIILKSLRESLAVDSALMSESIKEGILDGKTQIDEAHKELETTKQQLAVLKESLATTQANLILEQKTALLPEKKKAYAKRVLAGKSPKFITENIDYTLSLFDKKDEERLDTLKDEAFDSRIATDDVITEEYTEIDQTINENSDPNLNSYLGELQRY